MSFGENLSRERRARGMSQEELAAQVQVSRQAISKWENGDAMPDLPKLLAVADALGISLDELCGRADYAAAVEAVAAENTAAPLPKKHLVRALLQYVAVLLLGFALAMLFGMGGPPGGTAANPPLQAESLSISGLSFGPEPGGYLSYNFTPSVSAPGLEYRIVFTDSDGNSKGFDAPCVDGVCSGTVGGLVGYYGYTVSISVTGGRSTLSVAVANNLNFSENSASWTPLK